MPRGSSDKSRLLVFVTKNGVFIRKISAVNLSISEVKSSSRLDYWILVLYGKLIILYVEVLKVDMINSVKQGVRGGSSHRFSGALSRAIGGPPILTVKSKGGSLGGSTRGYHRLNWTQLATMDRRGYTEIFMGQNWAKNILTQTPRPQTRPM